ncbi:MAG: glycosyltransferase family 4 protein [Bacteroidia bacterium]|nr:glycosyltransferase family 4 protein [Bacteroidia bacterium]
MKNKMLKIAIVTPEFVTESTFDGGLANYTYRLAKSLLDFGHKPVVFVASNVTEQLFLENIEVQRVLIDRYDDWLYSNKYLSIPYARVKRFLYKPLKISEREVTISLKRQSAKLNKSLMSIHMKESFDIVHYANLGSVGYYKSKNIPSVARLSGSNAIWFEYGGYGETKKQVNRMDELEMSSLKKMDDIFGPCKSISDMVEVKINRKIELIESLYINEVVQDDLSVYNEFLKDKKYLLFFGTVSQVKGIGTISEIIHSFFKLYPDYYFVVVGKNSHSITPGITMLEILKEKAKEYKDHVIYLNQLPHSKLFPVLNNAEFVVLPSRIDNFPNTCVESMAHGKIVIGTIGNGFEQLIVDGESGFLINVDDSDMLLKRIIHVLNLNNEEKKQIEMNAKERIELLKPNHIIPKIIGFYERAIEKFNTKRKR